MCVGSVLCVPFWKPAGNCTGPLLIPKPTVCTSRPVSILTESTIFFSFFFVDDFSSSFLFSLFNFFLTGALVYNRRLFGLMRFPVAHAHGTLRDDVI